MPEVTWPLTRGAFVRIKLLPTGRGAIPVTGLGILDTGASHSHIDQSTATIHRFTGLGAVRTNTASQTGVQVPTFEMDVELVDFPGLRFPVRALGFPAPTQDPSVPPADRLIALIGRDILNQGCFTYDGIGGSFTLELP